MSFFESFRFEWLKACFLYPFMGKKSFVTFWTNRDFVFCENIVSENWIRLEDVLPTEVFKKL